MNDHLFVIQALNDLANEADSRGLLTEADELTSVMNLLIKISGLITKEAIIQKEKKKGKTVYKVKSEKNKKWNGGEYSTEAAAKKRLKEVEMFKHMKK